MLYVSGSSGSTSPISSPKDLILVTHALLRVAGARLLAVSHESSTYKHTRLAHHKDTHASSCAHEATILVGSKDSPYLRALMEYKNVRLRHHKDTHASAYVNKETILMDQGIFHT